MSREARLVVATSEGLVYVFALDTAEGGECALLRTHRLADTALAPRPPSEGTCARSSGAPTCPRSASSGPARGAVSWPRPTATALHYPLCITPPALRSRSPHAPVRENVREDSAFRVN